jgi:hypothetical protein
LDSLVYDVARGPAQEGELFMSGSHMVMVAKTPLVEHA